MAVYLLHFLYRGDAARILFSHRGRFYMHRSPVTTWAAAAPRRPHPAPPRMLMARAGPLSSPESPRLAAAAPAPPVLYVHVLRLFREMQMDRSI